MAMQNRKIANRTLVAVLALLLTAAMLFAAFAPIANAYSYIGTSKAKSIALDDAGLKSSEVRMVKANRHRQNRTVVYTVVFLSSTTKYVYKINAYSGEIETQNSYPLDGKDGASSETGSASSSGASNGASSQKTIGKSKARAIALKHAGISEKNVRDTETGLKRKGDARYYKVEFETRTMEYEYKIDAYSGEILDWESDEN